MAESNDMSTIKKDFPIFNQKINGNELVYLDSSATSQKPKVVIDAIVDFYTKYNANVSRSAHFLAEAADEKFEEAREKVAKFINAHKSEIVFTKNATEGLNMAAFSWGGSNLNSGDVVITTIAEHNSNILPWKSLANATGVNIEYLDVSEEGFLLHGWNEKLKGAKVVVVTHVSNVLGNIMPIGDICKIAKKAGAIVVVDGSQAVGHVPVNVKSLGCDFYAFSGHKMFGPTGIGVLWGKKVHLENMSPLLMGGGMVKLVKMDSLELGDIPGRFEGGTPNIAGAIGLGAAVDYLNGIGIQKIREHDIMLAQYAMEKLTKIEGLKILGPKDPNKRIGLVSFIVDGIHSHDFAAVLSSEGIAVRSGMQCTMHLYEKFDISSSTRASFHIYNSKEDVDKFILGVKKAIKILRKS